jgi:hypothetical protein
MDGRILAEWVKMSIDFPKGKFQEVVWFLSGVIGILYFIQMIHYRTECSVSRHIILINPSFSLKGDGFDILSPVYPKKNDAAWNTCCLYLFIKYDLFIVNQPQIGLLCRVHIVSHVWVFMMRVSPW